VVVDAEIFLDEFVRAGNDPDIETEKKSGQGGSEADEVDDRFGFAGKRLGVG
jgi:hypothetical protein